MRIIDKEDILTITQNMFLLFMGIIFNIGLLLLIAQAEARILKTRRNRVLSMILACVPYSVVLVSLIWFFGDVIVDVIKWVKNGKTSKVRLFEAGGSKKKPVDSKAKNPFVEKSEKRPCTDCEYKDMLSAVKCNEGCKEYKNWIQSMRRKNEKYI